MDKDTPVKYAKAMLGELAQIRAVVESLHDINTNLFQHLSGVTGKSKVTSDRWIVAKIKKQQMVIYASLLKRAGLSD